MNPRLYKLIDELTGEEQAFLETVVELLVDRRRLSAISEPVALESLIEALGPGDQSNAGRSGGAGKRSVLELRGLGKDLWRDVDVAEYLNRERDSWHGLVLCQEDIR